MGNNPKSGCIFCDALAQEDGPENLIVTRGPLTFVMMNRYPYTSGHIMVVPKDHQPSLELLSADTRTALMETVAHGIQVMRLVYKPEGFNVGVNIGTVSGAGVADHVHMHIVPRWAGDTNFMSTLAGARVLPEALEDSFHRLREAWNKV